MYAHVHDPKQVLIAEIIDIQKPRTFAHTYTWRRWAPFFIIVLAVLASLCATFSIGYTIQKHTAQSTKYPIHLYTGPTVCAFHTPIFKSYANATLANIAHDVIVHCGPCGTCSNIQDIHSIQSIQSHVYQNIQTCMIRGFGVQHSIRSCLREKMTFTEKCNDCYTDLASCGVRQCTFVCLTTMMLHKPILGGNGSLNECHQCIDTLCNDDFLSCAGADMRRLHIESSVSFPSNQMCTLDPVKNHIFTG